jgi:divalent metal cation (Fe/Co/Zn/Cd) transporter
LFEDTAALLGLFIAAAGLAIGQWFDMPTTEGVASIVIGALLASTASFLAYESNCLLTGEGVQSEVRASIRRLAEAEPGITRLKPQFRGCPSPLLRWNARSLGWSSASRPPIRM